MIDKNTQALIKFEAQKRTDLVAFWVALAFGIFGGHRFLFGKIKSAIVMLILFVLSLPMAMILGAAWQSPLIGIFGLIMLLIASVWLFTDLFRLTGWVRTYNLAVAERVITDIK